MMLPGSDQWRWQRPRSVAEPAEPEWCGINNGGFTRDDLRHQPTGAWPDAESVSGETGRNEEPRQRIHVGNHRYAIRSHIDHATPGFGDLHRVERRERRRQIGARLVQNWLVRLWVQRAYTLER